MFINATDMDAPDGHGWRDVETPAWTCSRGGQVIVALQCDDDPGSRCCFSLAWFLTFLFIDRRQGAYCSYGIVPYGTIVISPVTGGFSVPGGRRIVIGAAVRSYLRIKIRYPNFFVERQGSAACKPVVRAGGAVLAGCTHAVPGGKGTRYAWRMAMAQAPPALRRSDGGLRAASGHIGSFRE